VGKSAVIFFAETSINNDAKKLENEKWEKGYEVPLFL
jgi:hypothetical protein